MPRFSISKTNASFPIPRFPRKFPTRGSWERAAFTVGNLHTFLTPSAKLGQKFVIRQGRPARRSSRPRERRAIALQRPDSPQFVVVVIVFGVPVGVCHSASISRHVPQQTHPKTQRLELLPRLLTSHVGIRRIQPQKEGMGRNPIGAAVFPVGPGLPIPGAATHPPQSHAAHTDQRPESI
jgi:hypothetical protein